MHISQIILERRHTPYVAGILCYRAWGATQVLPWSVDLRNPRKLVVDFYPDDRQMDSRFVTDHQNDLADSLLAWLSRQIPA